MKMESYYLPSQVRFDLLHKARSGILPYAYSLQMSSVAKTSRYCYRTSHGDNTILIATTSSSSSILEDGRSKNSLDIMLRKSQRQKFAEESLFTMFSLRFRTMKLQLLLIAVCVCTASAGIPKKLFKKYAMKKVMPSLASSHGHVKPCDIGRLNKTVKYFDILVIMVQLD